MLVDCKYYLIRDYGNLANTVYFDGNLVRHMGKQWKIYKEFSATSSSTCTRLQSSYFVERSSELHNDSLDQLKHTLSYTQPFVRGKQKRRAYPRIHATARNLLQCNATIFRHYGIATRTLRLSSGAFNTIFRVYRLP